MRAKKTASPAIPVDRPRRPWSDSAFPIQGCSAGTGTDHIVCRCRLQAPCILGHGWMLAHRDRSEDDEYDDSCEPGLQHRPWWYF